MAAESVVRSAPSMTLADLQKLIRDMYLPRDVERGIEGTFMWLVEEIGELATALRHGSPAERAGEFADVLAWLATIANVAGIDLSQAVYEKYGKGCPGCHASPCVCPESEKP
jgi:NTP pyrophosphatase (non-canonical NTP hydrolase)